MTVRRALGLALALLVLYGVAPTLFEVLDAWPAASRIEPWWYAVMIVCQAGSLYALWLLQRLCVGGERMGPFVTAGLASGAVGRVVPGGAAVQAATQYAMLTRAGLPAGAVGPGLAAGALLQFAALCALPVLVLPAFVVGRLEVSTGLLTTSAIALGLFLGMLVLALFGLRSDRTLRRAVSVARAVARRLPTANLPADALERATSRRDDLARALGTRWLEAVAAGAARWALDLLTLLAACLAVGAEPRLALLLLAFVFAQLLAQFPITPGGVGIVEAGLTTTLVLAGVGGGQAAVATLAYRLVSYWLLLPAGLVGWLLHRRRYGSEAAPPLTPDAAARP